MKVSHSRNEAKASPVVKTVMAFLNTHSSSGTPRSRGRNSTPSPTSESTDVPLKRVSHSRSSSAAWQGGGRHTCFLASATVCLFLLYLTLLDSATHRAVISHTKKIVSDPLSPTIDFLTYFLAFQHQLFYFEPDRNYCPCYQFLWPFDL